MAPHTAPPEAARLVASDVNLWSCSCEKCDLKRVVRGGGRKAGGRPLQLRAEAGEECRARIAGTVQGVTDMSKAVEIFLLSMCLTPALSVFAL